MRKIWRGFRMELMPTLSLAGPVVLAELGWMAMGIVDTIFVGRLGAEAIGAVSLGSAMYFAVADLRHGAAPGPRHPGVAGLRRRPAATSAIAGWSRGSTSA